MNKCCVCGGYRIQKRKSTRPVILSQQIIFVDTHFTFCFDCELDIATDEDLLKNSNIMTEKRRFAEDNFNLLNSQI